MKKWCGLVVLALGSTGCGAHYAVTRTTPDGSTISATATTAERAGSMAFSFEGDPAGEMKIRLTKENTEPVNMTADVLRQLLGLAGGVP